MQRVPLAALMLASLVASCGGRASSDCDRAVHHVLFELTSPHRGGRPSPDETAAIEQAFAITVPICKREGLTQAQLDCLFAARSAEDLPAIARCPAIAANRPSWLLLGTP
jgi:hypothetical protein